MIEEIVINLLEKSLIGGAFIYMLHFILVRFSGTLESVASTLEQTSKTLISLDSRMDLVEKRISDMERNDKNGQC